MGAPGTRLNADHHNRAVDLLRSRTIREAEPLTREAEAVPCDTNDSLEGMLRQEALTAAIARFTRLPVTRRSAVVSKDVLDHSLQDIALPLGTTVDGVKAHLARGRARLRQLSSLPASAPPSPQVSHGVVRYVELFNRRDWEGLRNLLADDVNLQQAGRPVRTGAVDVGMFFTFYAKYEPVRLVFAILEGRHVIAVFELGSDPTPSYFMGLEWLEGKISFIHDPLCATRHSRR